MSASLARPRLAITQSECQTFFREYWQFVDAFDTNGDSVLDVSEFVGLCEAFLDHNNTVLRTFYATSEDGA
jgi:hypothetical protein